MAKRILIVEDHSDLRHLFADALHLAGFDVVQAEDGLQALRHIDGDRFDLVVLDLDLPIFSGVEVRQELAANVLTRHIPVVVVTGTPADDLCKLVTVECLMKKPVFPEELVNTVRKCLAAHGRP